MSRRLVDTAATSEKCNSSRSVRESVPGPRAAAGQAEPAPRLAVLRCPDLRLTTHFRLASIAHARGQLPPTAFRLVQFLTQQRLDPATGRVEGRWATDQVDGGMALAERYACVHQIGNDRFWADMTALYRLGWAEKAVAPAPGRRAVYALSLRADAIPSDLPEDLMRELRVWDLPEAEDPDEDAAYGRLTTRQAPPAAAVPAAALLAAPEHAEQAGREFGAAARWEHPTDSKAAAVAHELRTQWQQAHSAADPWPGWEPVEEPRAALTAPAAVKPAATPDLRCIAVADPDRAAEMTARVRRLMSAGDDGKASPLYARGFSQLCGYQPTGSSRAGAGDDHMAKTRTTPSAAPTQKRCGEAFGDDPGAVAWRVQRRVWHSWRCQLGRDEVFLPTDGPEGASGSFTGSAWTDLHHVIELALRQGATPALLFEMLTSNIVRRDQWGRLTHKADAVGRLGAWRLWRYIRSCRTTTGPRRRPVEQARHVTYWDKTTQHDRDTIRARLTDTAAKPLPDSEHDPRAEDARARAQAAAAQRRRDEQARWEQTYAQWGISSQYWREPEHVHLAQYGEDQDDTPTPGATRADVLARARADKAARRKQDRRSPAAAREESRATAARKLGERLAQRLNRTTTDDN